MGQLNVELEKRMRAQTGRRNSQPIRKTVNLEAPPTVWDRLAAMLKYVLYATLFVGGFAGGFVLVLYAVQLPGFPRLS
jgi:hypothetical protein